MHHKYLLYLFLLSSLPLNAMDDQKNSNEITIHKAVYFRNKERVQELLDSGVDVNEKTKEKKCSITSELHIWDNFNDSCEIIMWEKGDTPFHIAVERSNELIVHFLSKRNASVNIQNIHGNTPLHIATHQLLTTPYTKKYLSIIKMLIKYNAPVKIENNHGTIPLNILLKIKGIKELYLDNEKPLKKTEKKRKIKRRKITSNANKL